MRKAGSKKSRNWPQNESYGSSEHFSAHFLLKTLKASTGTVYNIPYDVYGISGIGTWSVRVELERILSPELAIWTANHHRACLSSLFSCFTAIVCVFLWYLAGFSMNLYLLSHMSHPAVFRQSTAVLEPLVAPLRILSRAEKPTHPSFPFLFLFFFLL